MKKYLKSWIAILGCVLVFSCSNYLDVQPEDKLLESIVFSNESSIHAALNNVYSSMASDNIYGGNLTMTTVDVLAQRYSTLEDLQPRFWHRYGIYDYDDSVVQGGFNAIWSNMYINILNINNFISGLDTYEGALSEEKKNLLKGEAIALRAMHHFDLLRLFGPIYSENPEADAIPYNTEAKAELTAILPATKVMELILADLAIAEGLLENDPIREFGKIAILEEDVEPEDPEFDYNGSDFYRFRNLRLNYFAVKALQARANLYAGDNIAALAAAKTVINEASKWFAWTDPLDVISAGKKADRIFSSEVLFAVQNNNLYNQYDRFFSDELGQRFVLTSNSARLETVFEANLNDYRFNSTWAVPSIGGFDTKTFFKFVEISVGPGEAEVGFKFMQPLVRISEMYYIAAEAELDATLALGYLNTVRFNRGLIDLPADVDINVELLKEYEKEFYGEGQLFFYYKRHNFSTIPDGSSDSGTVDMNVSTYVVPLPLSETNFRND
ncbi:RagB/SusD family nutrient uptake outer membrane protein [Flavivirga spongiicola]|uniref:RagB/SusD family nutrient uptake outer membrane protein n=1 Tax=Flavivirga spongiicola TaxID=421621 RepID=A0ABU7XQP5_9FLAO|nr:RagB/SusD family nutrient uptake outer membrane protein [Flavivirga sp. MEBiC05379]MDO5977851.1 RagB/SusD family nutrient uptake outer membrane protein [Flavivirga sp. MEBiC05379]